MRSYLISKAQTLSHFPEALQLSVLASLIQNQRDLYAELSLQDQNLLFILMMETAHWKKSGIRKDSPVTLSLHTCY